MKNLFEMTRVLTSKSAILSLLTISCLAPSMALSQTKAKEKSKQKQVSGPRDGAGGELVRLDIVAVRNFLYEICDKLDALKRENISCVTLRLKMDEVGVGERLLIEEVVTLNDGKPRTGRNRDWIPDITYSSIKWLEAKDDSIAKIGIQLHENLGLLNIEGTDDYRVSSQVVNELRMKSLSSFLPGNDRASRLTFKKWAEKFITTPDRNTIEANPQFRSILGKTQKGEICALYVTDKQVGGVIDGEFYLSLGIGHDQSQHDFDAFRENARGIFHKTYIGGFGSEGTTVQVPNIHEINFRTVRDGGEFVNGNFVNMFINSWLKVELTDEGQVWRVIGESTIDPIAKHVVCNFR